MDFGGMDSEGRTFTSVDEMWRETIGDTSTNKSQWYRDGVAYWQNIEPSVNGVLGGYGHVNDQDIKGSEAFLTSILNHRFSPTVDLVALDCGSGIGRIAKNLLLKHFNQVDLLEPVSHFLEAARESLGVETVKEHSAVNFFCAPLQEFTPELGRYNVIWVQWCIGHLTDDDFVSFFKRAKTGLKPGGFFVVKENIAKTGFVLDKEDRSITRSDLYFRELFKQCGLHLYKVKEQKGLPDELFAVNMYALTLDKPKNSSKRKSKVQTNRPEPTVFKLELSAKDKTTNIKAAMNSTGNNNSIMGGTTRGRNTMDVVKKAIINPHLTTMNLQRANFHGLVGPPKHLSMISHCF